jgi:superfamily I DNA/RNA helicase
VVLSHACVALPQVGIFAHYQALLKQCNAVDFNDLLGHVVELLGSHEG